LLFSRCGRRTPLPFCDLVVLPFLPQESGHRLCFLLFPLLPAFLPSPVVLFPSHFKSGGRIHGRCDKLQGCVLTLRISAASLGVFRFPSFSWSDPISPRRLSHHFETSAFQWSPSSTAVRRRNRGRREHGEMISRRRSR